MATNAITWFYNTPEVGRPYLIAERVNHTFWTNRITDIFFQCSHAEAPFVLAGIWNGTDVEIEFEPQSVFILRMGQENERFMKGVAEVLGFPPTVSYQDSDGRYVVEWYAKDAAKRLQEVQGNSSFRNPKVYKR
jgi:hypothetical protein